MCDIASDVRERKLGTIESQSARDVVARRLVLPDDFAGVQREVDGVLVARHLPLRLGFADRDEERFLESEFLGEEPPELVVRDAVQSAVMVNRFLRGGVDHVLDEVDHALDGREGMEFVVLELDAFFAGEREAELVEERGAPRMGDAEEGGRADDGVDGASAADEVLAAGFEFPHRVVRGNIVRLLVIPARAVEDVTARKVDHARLEDIRDLKHFARPGGHEALGLRRIPFHPTGVPIARDVDDHLGLLGVDDAFHPALVLDLHRDAEHPGERDVVLLESDDDAVVFPQLQRDMGPEEPASADDEDRFSARHFTCPIRPFAIDESFSR